MSASIDTSAEDFFRQETSYNDAGYCPHSPTPRQRAGLLMPQFEVLYGGAAGGGKTDWALMGALQYVNIPGYAALVTRRTFAQLSKSDGLIPRSHEWLANTPARWSAKDSKWTFPSGAVIEFGHIQHEIDKYNYQGAAFQAWFPDELTQYTESIYRYLISRIRRPSDPLNPLSRVPLRIRATSNPGGEGHDWVKRRFITERNPDRVFIPAKLADNPYLDAEQYAKGLALLDPVTRAQLLNGDWTVRASGGYFKREWVDVIDEMPSDGRMCRGWDLASTERKKKNKDPDYTVGARMTERNDHWFVGPILRKQFSANKLDNLLAQTAQMDGQACKVRIEQEPGSSGKIASAHFIKLLAGFDVKCVPATGSKLSRFQRFASQCEAGNVTFINGPWVGECFDELEALTDNDSHAHDDQADAVAIAFNELTMKRSRWGEAIAAMEAAAA